MQVGTLRGPGAHDERREFFRSPFADQTLVEAQAATEGTQEESGEPPNIPEDLVVVPSNVIVPIPDQDDGINDTTKDLVDMVTTSADKVTKRNKPPP